VHHVLLLKQLACGSEFPPVSGAFIILVNW